MRVLSYTESVVLQSGSSLPSGRLIMLLVLGVVGVALVLGGIYFMATRGIFSPDAENQQTAQEREEAQRYQQDSGFKIPLRDRLRAVSGPGKAALLSLVLIVGFVIYVAYKILQTGSPATDYLTFEVIVVVVGFIGILGGSTLRGWAENRIGTLYNVYESPHGRRAEKLEFFRDERRLIGSEDTVPLLHPDRLLGVFRRHQLVGNHPKLRSSAKPLGDRVTSSVPEGEHSFEVDDGVIINLTQGEPIYHRDPGAATDISYRSPDNLSYQRATELRESQRRKDIQLQGLRATDAVKDSEMERLADMLENREWTTRESLMELLQEFADMQNNRQTTTTTEAQQSGMGRSSDASSSVLEEVDADGNGHAATSGGESDA